jgi:hypothetical protein
VFSQTASAVALAAATAKTVIELSAGSTVDAALIGFDVTFDGVTSSAVPVKVEIITYGTTGTGTGGTPSKANLDSRAAAVTSKTNMTVEGTSSIVTLATWVVPPTSGLSYLFPLGREPKLPPSKSLGLRLTAPAVVNATANLWFEE